MIFRREVIFWFCLVAFMGGFLIWGVAEKRSKEKSSLKPIPVPSNSKWNPAEVFIAARKIPRIETPFLKEIVTEVKDGSTFVLSTGEEVKLVGIVLPSSDSEMVKEAEDLAQRLVGQREVFLEFEPSYHGEKDDYAYLYFRIPIIPSQPPVGPEYVHWSLNAELLKLGYAKVDESFPFKHLAEFREYEREAKIQRRGIWKKV